MALLEPPMTDEHVGQLATDVAPGRVFLSGHVANPGDLSMVFLPLALGGFEAITDEEAAQVGQIYEYRHRANPDRTWNGMPVFSSLNYASVERLGESPCENRG